MTGPAPVADALAQAARDADHLEAVVGVLLEAQIRASLCHSGTLPCPGVCGCVAVGDLAAEALAAAGGRVLPSRGREGLPEAMETGDPALRPQEPPEALPRPRGAVVVDVDTGQVWASWAPAHEVIRAIADWREAAGRTP